MTDEENRLRSGSFLYWILLTFFVLAVGFSFYSSVFPRDTGQKQAVIATGKAKRLCEVGIAKSAIIEDFMLSAAAARRASAAAETNPVVIKNDLAVANQYEEYARRYYALTVKNC